MLNSDKTDEQMQNETMGLSVGHFIGLSRILNDHWLRLRFQKSFIKLKKLHELFSFKSKKDNAASSAGLAAAPESIVNITTEMILMDKLSVWVFHYNPLLPLNL